MGTLVSNATTTFAATTGFSMSDLVTWSVDNLLKVFLGAGVAVLYELRYWIVGLIVIGIILYFSFRGLGFFKH